MIDQNLPDDVFKQIRKKYEVTAPWRIKPLYVWIILGVLTGLVVGVFYVTTWR